MTKINDVLAFLHEFANPMLQESYDNARLLTGNGDARCRGVLVSLDATEDIVNEAVRKKCNLVVSHHPILFRGLKKITGDTYVERTLITAIKNNIALFAIHTNLDNVIYGVNSTVASLLKLKNCRVLAEKGNTLKKLETFVPAEYAEKVRSALFSAGAGAIGRYDQCSFNISGQGTFRPLEGADPFSGKTGERFQADEVRIEVVFPFYIENKIIAALRENHPYEEVAFYITPLSNTERGTGSGIIGELNNPMEEKAFLRQAKKLLKAKVIRHTALLDKPVRKVAFCGGSGFFLLPYAIAQQADIYITADIKYHEFFDADSKIILADAGHYETEQYAIDLLTENIKNNFPTFAVLKTENLTNPVHYLT